jgi:hypothetical protein
MHAFWGAVTTGAVAGFAGGVVGTLLNGGSLAQALRAGFTGALFGGLSAGLAYGVAEMTASVFHIGSKAAHSLSLFHTGGKVTATLFKAVAHGISRAIITKAQGGRWSSGFWSGFASSAFSVGTKGYGGITGRTMIMAVVGGTVSELTGGKFANGAVSGAFVHLFNAEGGTLSKIWKGLTGGISKVYDRKDEILSDAKTGLNAHVKDIPKALKGGLNGYRQVRDNAPAVPRYMLKGAMTAVELGLTKWIKDPVLYIYVNVNTGVYMDTIPLNPVSFSANRIHNYSSHDSSWFE